MRVGKIGCRPVEMRKWLGRSVGSGGRKMLKSVNDDMKLLGLQPEWATFRNMWRVVENNQDLIFNYSSTKCELS